MLTRRGLLKGALITGAGAAATGGYAVAEPFRLVVTTYAITPRRWPAGLRLKLAVIADLHACEPWMPVGRIEEIAAATNALAPDATLLLGDYVTGLRRRYADDMPAETWARALGVLRAPLGVHAVMGNHDWWEDREAQRLRRGPVRAQRALEAAGIPVLENRAVKLAKDGHEFWLAGLGDQWAFWRPRRIGPEWHRFEGVHDLGAALGAVPESDPVILMAHEPDIFPEVPERVSLTVSGHTHGGQVRIAGYAPIVPSRFGRRFLYGHIVEEGRDLVVSGGLGCSTYPVRMGVPPEIVVIEVGAA